MQQLETKSTLTVLENLGITEINPAYGTGQVYGGLENNYKIEVTSPIDHSFLAEINFIEKEQYEDVIIKAQETAKYWKKIPAPKRGEIIRQIGEELRKNKESLGKLVSLEMGKSYQEALGEVQEMIDICDFAVGLSRQLYGLTMHSERPEHRMYEQYHPLGIVGVISSFNFPVAVWSWNAMIAAVCGNVIVWKPSEKTPLTAVACQYIISKVLERNKLPEGIFNFVIGDKMVGNWIAEDTRIPLVSATGSTKMGRKVAQKVAARLGKSILELGGNNAIILTENANLAMAIRAVVFGAVGTCGQRCTTTRRLIIHQSIFEVVKEKLIQAYQSLKIGNPLENDNLVGPLIDKEAFDKFQEAIQKVQEEGGTLLYGGDWITKDLFRYGYYVTPALIEAENHYEMVQEETFAPILYLIAYEGDVQNAIDLQNSVKQGLSSAIFSDNIRETEMFLNHSGSDCGIANVNIGTSGAEIGGAFGGEKDTGGGRESGSDAWKAYMRRQTNTINYGKELPLAQGIRFDI